MVFVTGNHTTLEPRGLMVKALDYGLEVSVFELQSRYYIPFRTNTLKKFMNTIISHLSIE